MQVKWTLMLFVFFSCGSSWALQPGEKVILTKTIDFAGIRHIHSNNVRGSYFGGAATLLKWESPATTSWLGQTSPYQASASCEMESNADLDSARLTVPENEPQTWTVMEEGYASNILINSVLFDGARVVLENPKYPTIKITIACRNAPIESPNFLAHFGIKLVDE